MKNNSNYQNENTNARQFNYECGSAIGYFTESDYIEPGIYKNPAGYTPNAWTGSNCPKDRFLPVKEVAGYIREYIKKDPELRACKWSVYLCTVQTKKHAKGVAPEKHAKNIATKQTVY